MAQSMGLCLMPAQDLVQMCGLYQVAGDIELLSLHRIKNRIVNPKTGLALHPVVRGKLINEMLAENKEYREFHNNGWYCLTPNGLDSAIESTQGFLQEGADEGLESQIFSSEAEKDAYKSIMNRFKENEIQKTKQWFSTNYDHLLYDKEANIPYPVVMAMRRSFRQWAFNNSDPFMKPIEEFTEEVAREVGLDTRKYSDYQHVWDELRRRDKRA